MMRRVFHRCTGVMSRLPSTSAPAVVAVAEQRRAFDMQDFLPEGATFTGEAAPTPGFARPSNFSRDERTPKKDAFVPSWYGAEHTEVPEHTDAVYGANGGENDDGNFKRLTEQVSATETLPAADD